MKKQFVSILAAITILCTRASKSLYTDVGCMLVSFLLFLLFFGGVILMLSCVID